MRKFEDLVSPVTEQLRRNFLPPEGARVDVTREAPAGGPSRVICSLAAGRARDLLLESVSTLAAYAQHHSWNLVLSSEPLAGRTQRTAELALVQELLGTHDFVLSMPPDAVIVDLEHDVLDGVTPDADFWRVGATDAASFLVRSCPNSKATIAAALATGAEQVLAEMRIGRLDVGEQTVIREHARIDDLDVRCRAVAADREATVERFPSLFQHLRSPASAGVDHPPRRSQAFEPLDFGGEPPIEELLAIIDRLDATNEAQRARIVELLDLLEAAADERVNAERHAEEVDRHAANVEAELDLLRNTKLFRLATPARRVYGSLTRWRHG